MKVTIKCDWNLYIDLKYETFECSGILQKIAATGVEILGSFVMASSSPHYKT